MTRRTTSRPSHASRTNRRGFMVIAAGAGSAALGARTCHATAQPSSPAASPQPDDQVITRNATMTVLAGQVGVSTRYIGANRGITNFDIADFQDLGINTYRFYGGMGPWEYQDDDGEAPRPTTGSSSSSRMTRSIMSTRAICRIVHIMRMRQSRPGRPPPTL